LPSFLSLPENKDDLAFFLAKELIRQAPEGKVVITGGGFIGKLECRGRYGFQLLF
jgi:hypothetical protein